jgi:hypothetical protein
MVVSALYFAAVEQGEPAGGIAASPIRHAVASLGLVPWGR